MSSFHAQQRNCALARAHQRIAWEEQLDRLGAYLKTRKQGTSHGRSKK
jgi:hypothetical protein